MDPLSISASVAGLVTLAGAVFSLAAKYIKDAKEAPMEAKDLLDEVKQFSILLHHLSLVAHELEIAIKPGEEALQDSPNLQLHYVYDCQTILNRVEIGLQRATDGLDSSSTLIKTRSRLKWPFSSNDTKDIIQRIQRYKQMINIALSANSYSRLAICLSRQEAADKRQEEMNDRLGNIHDTVDEILDINTKVFLDAKRREVLDFFSKFANPSRDLEMVHSLHHPSTGLWFTESDNFKEWRATPGSKLWITGIPGAGKSVLAGLIIYECLKLSLVDSGKATTYFFCTYKDRATHSARKVLSSLAAQLARQNEEAFRILERYHQELVSQKHSAEEPSQQKLSNVFETMCRVFDQVFVIVDGLDECETDEVVRSLSQLSLKMNSASITALLLSRDVVNIRDRLEPDFVHTKIAAHTEDIQLYVLTELEKRIESKQLRLRNPQLKTEIMDKLVTGAMGMFRWVACQLDYLGELPNDREKRDALSKLPPTIIATYERILLKVEKSGKAMRSLVQKTLLLIRASLCDVDYLSEALSIRDDSNVLTEEDTVDEYEIMRRCSSLIRKSADGKRLEFSHFTVQEFLEGIDPMNATLCPYRVSHLRAQAALAQIYLRYLMLQNFQYDIQADMEHIQHIQKRTQTKPFYRHCTGGWIECVRELVDEKPDKNDAHIDATTMELIRELFDSRKTRSFCQWVIDRVDSWASHSHTCVYLDHEDTIVTFDISTFDFGGNTHREGRPEDKQAFVDFISAIIRPDFTPLHMASVLGLPTLCDHLLKHGAKVNLKSRFGTPLHCALGGSAVFLRGSTLGSRAIATTSVATPMLPIAQIQTARLLLAAGASAAPRFSTPFQQRTLMGTMHLSPLRFRTFELLPDLLQAGLDVEEEDINPMKERLGYLTQIRQRMLNQHTYPMIVALLKDLRSANNNSSGPIQRLYSIVHRLAQRKHLILRDLVHEGGPEDIGNGLNILESLITNNDVIALQKMVDEDQHEVFKNARFDVGGEGWTAVHLACDSSSPDVLQLLLKIGINPETPTRSDTKPIHLTHAARDGGETLKALLQYPVSTAAKMGDLGNIWHLTIQNNDMQALKLLISLASDRDEALRVVSGSGQTAICVALAKQNGYAVSLLLKHCPTSSFWKSNMPLYRQAARLGSLEVVKKLLEVGIRLDDFDDELGSILHDISPRASVACVKLLVETFPHCYRQRKDGRIPFQSFFKRSTDIICRLMWKPGVKREDIEDDNNKHDQERSRVLETLLPAMEVSQSKGTVQGMVDILPLVCSTFVEYIPRAGEEVSWIKQLLTHVIDVGLMSCFEQKYKISALVLFATEVDQISSMLLPRWLAVRQGELCTDEKLPLMKNWACLSQMILEISSKTAFGGNAAEHESATRLLSHAILHDDLNLVKRLLQSGVDVHRRVESISALEAACIPAIDISEDTFRCLLSYAKTDRLNEHNDYWKGYTIVHLVGTRGPFQGRSLWKLEQILKAGANANAVSSDTDHDPVINFHISRNSTVTIEALLQAGADPWLTDAHGFNATLIAITKNNTSLLKTIAKHSVSRKLAAKWNQTWKRGDFSGGNAFHLAAMWGSEECMQVYLDEKWLDDLEALDDELWTPMHYAALCEEVSIIRYLYDRGCDIDRTAKDGKSPLHLAIEAEHLATAKALIELGAKLKVDARGLSPLVYAYRTGKLELVNALERRNENDGNMTFQLGPTGIAKMADAFYVALDKGDLDVCERFITQGLPIDSEMPEPWPVTPLMLALTSGMSLRIVEWLLRKGSKVSVLFEGPDMPVYYTALEAAISNQVYNSLLPTILRRYLREGGNFGRLRQTPLHRAVSAGNYEGLTILLDELRQASYNVCDIVNQKDGSSGNGSALHWAAQLDSVDAAALLISNGANLELIDRHGRTPLHVCAENGSIDVLKLLINLGARTEPLCLYQKWTPLMLACSEGEVEAAEYLLSLEQNIMEDVNGRDIVHITLSEVNEFYAIKLCAMLFPRGFDLHRADIRGLCAMSDVMSYSEHWVLRRLLREYPLSLRIQDVRWSSPQTWAEHTSFPNRLGSIIRGYRLVHRYLGRGEPLRVSDSVFVGKYSLLYLAASTGLVAGVDDLLSIGIDIDVEVCDEGTALTVAAAHGQLEVVKYLVRRGAKLSNQSSGSHEGTSAWMVAYEQKEVLQWLLVDRHTDQSKIMHANADADGEDRQVKEWSGVTQAKMPLKWEWEKRRGESMLEYAERFQEIKEEFRGKVVVNSILDSEEGDSDFDSQEGDYELDSEEEGSFGG
ncbi:ankyrin repeat-containing domain protein [Nemania abortiva]|nr:ankyrin repeat-containing domain protein [Nemania abortiva]